MTMLVGKSWIFALILGLVAAGAAGLVSAHNGDPAQIHGCVNQAATPRGQVIIYAAPGLAGGEPATSSCGTRGTPVDWNAQGVQGPAGPTGTTGATGATGTTGATGATGAPGLAALQDVSNSNTIASNSSGFTQANCPTGKVPISGGYIWGGPEAITSTFRTTTGWQVTIFNTGAPRPLVVSVLCATVS
jgi:hypothetical protein